MQLHIFTLCLQLTLKSGDDKHHVDTYNNVVIYMVVGVLWVLKCRVFPMKLSLSVLKHECFNMFCRNVVFSRYFGVPGVHLGSAGALLGSIWGHWNPFGVYGRPFWSIVGP